ncbi:TetR/AcrR family transcriptional regulator [Aeromicrobium stalagmiti]|uniref:TetR/AcrR family transcriptional regulator n=1 Tax=Aeromicrobium stalagmiti TaxID=2738988 RepID=UPI00156A631D|nr:TetR/AcrR family transcriptional regulator [Aeromicrobium stalagmiti]NRQ50358.1 TetR/AcrR family transcriptional regulator [Aeromicrobium stalagmiti]
MAQVSTERPAVRRRAATRERLLDAARTVLAREGIQGASVEHICEQAGFTRGAFYSNFASKDELVLALFDREREQMFTVLRAAADPSSFEGLDTLDAVGVIMDRFLLGQQQDREWYLVHAEFELRGVRDDAVGREFVAASRQVRTDFEAFLTSALEALGRRLTIELSHAATIVMGTYDTALREALLEDRPIDLGLLKGTLPALLLAVTEPVG